MIREAHDGFGESAAGPAHDSSASATDGDRRSGVERRADFRARTLVVGKVVIGETLTDCIVRNLSVRGAQVRVPGAGELPPSIQILLPGEDLLFDATIVWRNGDKIGVSFTAHRDLRRDGDAR
ncbi:MAG TPA: PilZ domain-containing protein [Caulobacteraceae bacterium]|nr:PilZ domain-containing protein [Caulobacteraceae bacterium]